MSETQNLATILVADVVGFSRLAGAEEERALALLRASRTDLFDPAISGALLPAKKFIGIVLLGIEGVSGEALWPIPSRLF